MTGRIVCASLFLPYTVDFELSRDKKSRLTASSAAAPHTAESIPPPPAPAANTNGSATPPAVMPPPLAAAANVPNLIDSLAAQQPGTANKPAKTTESAVTTEEEKLFDFKQPEQLVQPRSKMQREQELRKLAPLSVSTHQLHRRRPSLDSATVFDNAPWTVKPSIAGNIGLWNAINSIRDNRREQCVWIGTLGMPTDPLSRQTREKIRTTFIMEHDCYPIMPSDAEFEGHYNQYCKQVHNGKKMPLPHGIFF